MVTISNPLGFLADVVAAQTPQQVQRTSTPTLLDTEFFEGNI